jgi:hypothetical protein
MARMASQVCQFRVMTDSTLPALQIGTGPRGGAPGVNAVLRVWWL